MKTNINKEVALLLQSWDKTHGNKNASNWREWLNLQTRSPFEIMNLFSQTSSDYVRSRILLYVVVPGYWNPEIKPKTLIVYDCLENSDVMDKIIEDLIRKIPKDFKIFLANLVSIVLDSTSVFSEEEFKEWSRFNFEYPPSRGETYPGTYIEMWHRIAAVIVPVIDDGNAQSLIGKLFFIQKNISLPKGSDSYPNSMRTLDYFIGDLRNKVWINKTYSIIFQAIDSGDKKFSCLMTEQIFFHLYLISESEYRDWNLYEYERAKIFVKYLRMAINRYQKFQIKFFYPELFDSRDTYRNFTFLRADKNLLRFVGLKLLKAHFNKKNSGLGHFVRENILSIKYIIKQLGKEKDIRFISKVEQVVLNYKKEERRSESAQLKLEKEKNKKKEKNEELIAQLV